MQNGWGEGHNVLSLFELTCFRLQTEIASDLKMDFFKSVLLVLILCLLIVSAACQSGSPLCCDEDVTSNLPGILEENL